MISALISTHRANIGKSDMGLCDITLQHIYENSARLSISTAA